MATVGTRSGRVDWHELQTPDVDGAVRFYRALLAWDLEIWKPEEADYPIVRAGGNVHGGFQRTHPDAGIPPHWLAYVRVDDVDTVAEKARKLGGSLRVEPMDVRDVGRLAVVEDSEGAEIAVITPASDDPPRQGVFAWDDVLVEDVEAAKRFYGELFGWTTEDAMEGRYTLFKLGETSVAGLARRPDELPVSAWMTYLTTGDLDDALRRTPELGGSVVAEVMQYEGVGRWAVIEDPTGAVVALFEEP